MVNKTKLQGKTAKNCYNETEEGTAEIDQK